MKSYVHFYNKYLIYSVCFENIILFYNYNHFLKNTAIFDTKNKSIESIDSIY